MNNIILVIIYLLLTYASFCLFASAYLTINLFLAFSAIFFGLTFATVFLMLAAIAIVKELEK